MKLLLLILLFLGVTTTKISVINDVGFFYVTVQCDTDEDILITQFTKDGDMVGRHKTLEHKAGKRGHTISRYSQANIIRVRVGNDNFVFEIVNDFVGKCKLTHQYETVSS